LAEAALKLAKGVLEQPRHRTARASLEKRAHDEARAEAMLASGLAAAGLSRDDVARMPGSDARKVAIAPLIWGTTLSQGWLEERSPMGSAAVL
jgi:putative transposase